MGPSPASINAAGLRRDSGLWHETTAAVDSGHLERKLSCFTKNRGRGRPASARRSGLHPLQSSAETAASRARTNGISRPRADTFSTDSILPFRTTNASLKLLTVGQMCRGKR
jgi:hypothetical protein